MRDPADVERIAALETRVAELEGQLSQLRGDPASFQLLRPHGFNPRMAKMLVLIARQSPSTLKRDAIYASLGGDGVDMKSVDVLVCKTRRVIKARHIPGAIETIHGGGYRADARLSAWVLRTIGDVPDNPQLDLFEEKAA